MPNGLPVWPMPEDWCPESCRWVRSGDSSALTSGLSEFVKSWKTWECSDKCSICKVGIVPSGSWTLCSSCTDLFGELRTGSSDWARHWSAFSNWAFWPVWTGLPDSPGVTDVPGEPGVIGVPGVVTVPGLPSAVGGTEHRVPGPYTGYRSLVPDFPGPGVTRACSEYTGRLTGDCWTDPFVANQALWRVSQAEGLSTGSFDSDRGDLSCDSMPKVESPGGGFEPSAEVDPDGSTCDTVWTPYLPASSLAWDLAGVGTETET